MRHIHSFGRPVLAVAPSSTGFGYALFEGGDRLIDWGARRVAGNKNAQCVLHVATLIQLYRPRVILLEDPHARGARRWPRIKTLLDMLQALAKEKRIRCIRYARVRVAGHFNGPKRPTKERVAREIVRLYPELGPFLPPKRRIWETEDPRLAIFVAVSYALVFLAEEASH